MQDIDPFISDKPKKSKKLSLKNLDKKSTAIAGAIIILIILVGSFILFNTNKPKKSSKDKITPTITEEESEDITPTITPKPTKAPTSTPRPTITVPTLTPVPPTPTQEPVSHTSVINSDPSLDGFQSSNGGGNGGIEIRAGRNATLIVRGFVSFSLSTIPSGANITKATLKVYQHDTEGDPYGVGLRVMVDHLAYGDSFENSDYNLSSISSSFARLSENSDIGWKEVDVTDRVRDDMTNNRSRSQYRLHFANETIGGTGTGDFVYFESADNHFGTGNIPQLVINYTE